MYSLSVWYKTKFGSQNYGYQLREPFMHRLPKLVANISSQFHHLVNTGLAVGSLVKWLPIKVANTSKIDKCEWFIARQLEMAPSYCNHCAAPIFYSQRPWGAGFRSVNPAERWRENLTRALAQAECYGRPIIPNQKSIHVTILTPLLDSILAYC